MEETHPFMQGTHPTGKAGWFGDDGGQLVREKCGSIEVSSFIIESNIRFNPT